MKICKHSNCAVCTSENKTEREVFKNLLKTIHPEVYICNKVMYKIINDAGFTFDVKSLYFASQAEDGTFYIRDMFSAGNITLTKEKVIVMCMDNGECDKEPLVLEYKPENKAAE